MRRGPTQADTSAAVAESILGRILAVAGSFEETLPATKALRYFRSDDQGKLIY